MRPDTEPNIHAKRIMVGAIVLTVGLVLSHVTMWLLANKTTVALGIGVVLVAAFICYVLGTVTLDMAENIR